MADNEGFRDLFQSGTNTPRSQVSTSTPMRHGSLDMFRPNLGGTPGFTPAQSVAGTPMSQRQSNRTPISSVSQRILTPSGNLPRGDVGRGVRVPLLNRSDPVPSTPTRDGLPNYAGTVHDDDFSEIDPNEAHRPTQDEPLHDLTNTMIWGTTVVVQTCMNVFRNFIESFTVERGGDPYYIRELQIIYRSGNYLLNLNCAHLEEFVSTKTFHRQLIQYPHEIIPIMDRVIQEVYQRVVEDYAGAFADAEGQKRIQVRTYNLQTTSHMRRLDPEDIDKLISIKGMVIRCSSIIPDLKQAFFRCFVCGTSVDVLIDRGRIEEPKKCDQCQKVGAMELIHNRCLFTDKQMIRLQETPDEIPEGETPYTLTIMAYDDLVDTVRPGDRIEVTGIFRAIPRRQNPHMRTISSIFKTYLDAIHFRRSDMGEDKMVSTDETGTHTAEGVEEAAGGPQGGPVDMSSVKQFSAKRIEDFKAFVEAGYVYDRLVRSFAPSVWEMDDVKRGLLCLLFGGTIRRNQKKSSTGQKRKRGLGAEISRANKRNGGGEEEGEDEDEDVAEEVEEDRDPAEDDESLSVHQRGDINILLCGDPGTSKSQLLSYVHKITPRGIYTSGKGSSAVGLTASVVRDPETRDMVLESGALVLSDNGICCIDEFDKMSDTTRAILHEAMEQQTVSITKAGIIATLNARTSILASANPVESRYNARMSVVENIKLPPTLLSRFDLIYLVLDKPDEQSDRRLATHLVSLYHRPEEDHQTLSEAQLAANIRNPLELVDQRFLRDFIAYARNNICPEVSEEAEKVLVASYLEMRSLGGRGMKTITATPRQLESLIRISQALAKMRLSETVLASDVQEATRLMKVATQAAATDPRTGTIDMDMITTGRSALDRDLVMKLADQIRELFSTPAYKGKSSTIGNIRMKVIEDMKRTTAGQRASNEIAVTMDMVEAAVDELQGEGLVSFNVNTKYVIENYLENVVTAQSTKIWSST